MKDVSEVDIIKVTFGYAFEKLSIMLDTESGSISQKN